MTLIKGTVYLVLFAIVAWALLVVTAPLVEPHIPHASDFSASVEYYEGVYVDNEAYDAAVIWYAQNDSAFALEAVDLYRMAGLYNVGTSYSHAEERHPGATECIPGNDVMQIWENPFSGHCAEIRQVDGTTYNIRIVAKIKGRWEEITAFMDDAECLREIEEYLTNGQYMQIW